MTESIGCNPSDNMVTMTVLIDDALYRQVMTVIEPLGYTMERLLKEFIEETVRLGRIPFEYTEADVEAAKKAGGVEVIWST